MGLHWRLGESVGDSLVARADTDQERLRCGWLPRRQPPLGARRLAARRGPGRHSPFADVAHCEGEPHRDDIPGARSLPLQRCVQYWYCGDSGREGFLAWVGPRRPDRGLPGDTTAIAVRSSGVVPAMPDYSRTCRGNSLVTSFRKPAYQDLACLRALFRVITREAIARSYATSKRCGSLQRSCRLTTSWAKKTCRSESLAPGAPFRTMLTAYAKPQRAPQS